MHGGMKGSRRGRLPEGAVSGLVLLFLPGSEHCILQESLHQLWPLFLQEPVKGSLSYSVL